MMERKISTHQKKREKKTTPNNKIDSGQLILKHTEPTTAHAREFAHESFNYFIYIHFVYIIQLLLLS